MIRIERAPGAKYCTFILESTGERFIAVPAEHEALLRQMLGQGIPVTIEGKEIGEWSIEQFQKEAAK